MSIVQIFLLNIGALLTSLGGICLKRLAFKTSLQKLGDILSIVTNPLFILGGLCYILPIIIWGYLLKEIELSKLQPILVIVIIYTTILSYFFLGEEITLLRACGIIFIMIGVMVVGNT